MGAAETPIPDGARACIARYPLCFVASINEDGSPNLSPKGTIRVWDASHLVFAQIASPQTAANVKRDDRVEVNVVDHFARRGWRFRGRAVVTDDAAIVEALRQEYPDEPYPFTEAVMIRVEDAREVISPSYSLGYTEDELREQMRARADTQTVESGLLGVRAGAVCLRCEVARIDRTDSPDGLCDECRSAPA